ncbi:hypothetical protein JYQ62_22415 [Nostoc sp. UHCC 0702]|nr:hypothetical protein JYQ62_22415 [Nostoc sp. UHCC 0702]
MSYSSFVASSQKNIATKRDIKQVPFVELFNHRLQGVVSSGSDIERVYVSFFEAGTLDFYCSTNNNRPCGGLRGYPCKHLEAVMKEAIAAYGIDQVSNYLKVSGDVSQINSLVDILNRRGTVKKEPASEVFSRFLNYLGYLELETSNSPLPEMSWFI